MWVNHHVLNVGYVGDRLGGRPYYDALTMLTWVASRTTTVQLGTSVLVVPYLHPLTLAKTLATLDQLSGGRVVAGLGVGSLQAEHDAIGLCPFEKRGRYTDDAIAVLKAMWADPPGSYVGEFFRFDALIASPKPARPIPILVGGNRPPAIRRAAGVDGWHPLGVSPSGLAERLAVIEAMRGTLDGFAVSIRWDLGADPTLSKDIATRVAEYRDAGVTEIVWSVGSADLALQRDTLARLAGDVVGPLRSRS